MSDRAEPTETDLPEAVDVASGQDSDGRSLSPPLPADLDQVARRTRDFIEAASSKNTRRAYASVWR